MTQRFDTLAIHAGAEPHPGTGARVTPIFHTNGFAFESFLDELLQVEGLRPSQMILLGFSQGTMMSLHVAPRRSAPVAGVVGFSGRLLAPERLEEELVSRPPVLLVHGDADDVVPIASLREAGDALTRAGFETYGHVMRGTAHGIAPDGLSVALAFMREKLGIPGEAAGAARPDDRPA